MSIKKSVKYGKYKLSLTFLLHPELKRRFKGLPLYCRMTYMRRFTQFPVLGEHRFEHEDHIPAQVIEDSFELIKATFEGCFNSTKGGTYNIKKFMEKYRAKRSDNYPVDHIYISRMVSHLHHCFDNRFITEDQLNLCKNEILKEIKINKQ